VRDGFDVKVDSPHLGEEREERGGGLHRFRITNERENSTKRPDKCEKNTGHIASRIQRDRNQAEGIGESRELIGVEIREHMKIAWGERGQRGRGGIRRNVTTVTVNLRTSNKKRGNICR